MNDERAPEGPSETAPRGRSDAHSTDREAFDARRRAAMPVRHRQRLRNLRRSPDALLRLGDHPAFRALFAEAKRRAGGDSDA